MPPRPEDDDIPPESSPKPRLGLTGLLGFGKTNRTGDAGAGDDTSPANGARGQAMRLRLSAFESMRVSDVMIPRAEIAAVEIGLSFKELLAVFAENTHSRMPVYRESLDDPAGFIHLKDVIGLIARGGTSDDDKPIAELLRQLLYVPPSMRLDDLLVKMQTGRMHLALVVDEYGGTDGLVTLEDLVEQIVGDIEDEHDEEDAPRFLQRARGVWDADSRAEIVEVAEASGLDLSLPDYEDDIDTIGGLVFAIAGRVPQRGELIQHPSGVDMEILEADGRRIRRVRLRHTTPVRAAGEADPQNSTLEQGE